MPPKSASQARSPVPPNRLGGEAAASNGRIDAEPVGKKNATRAKPSASNRSELDLGHEDFPGVTLTEISHLRNRNLRSEDKLDSAGGTALVEDWDSDASEDHDTYPPTDGESLDSRPKRRGDPVKPQVSSSGGAAKSGTANVNHLHDDGAGNGGGDDEGSHQGSDRKPTAVAPRPGDNETHLAWIPIGLVVLFTAVVLYFCYPNETQWLSRVHHTTAFSKWVWRLPTLATPLYDPKSPTYAKSLLANEAKRRSILDAKVDAQLARMGVTGNNSHVEPLYGERLPLRARTLWAKAYESDVTLYGRQSDIVAIRDAVRGYTDMEYAAAAEAAHTADASRAKIALQKFVEERQIKNGTRVVRIRGPSGIGKTSVLSAYVRKTLEDPDFFLRPLIPPFHMSRANGEDPLTHGIEPAPPSVVIYLKANTLAALMRQLRELVDYLGIRVEDVSLPTLASRFAAFLEKQPSWILVVDDVVDEVVLSAIPSLVPRMSNEDYSAEAAQSRGPQLATHDKVTNTGLLIVVTPDLPPEATTHAAVVEARAACQQLWDAYHEAEAKSVAMATSVLESALGATSAEATGEAAAIEAIGLWTSSARAAADKLFTEGFPGSVTLKIGAMPLDAAVTQLAVALPRTAYAITIHDVNARRFGLHPENPTLKGDHDGIFVMRREQKEAALEELANRLARNPAAISLAAAYINAAKCSIGEYLEKFDQLQAELYPLLDDSSNLYGTNGNHLAAQIAEPDDDAPESEWIRWNIRRRMRTIKRLRATGTFPSKALVVSTVLNLQLAEARTPLAPAVVSLIASSASFLGTDLLDSWMAALSQPLIAEALIDIPLSEAATPATESTPITPSPRSVQLANTINQSLISRILEGLHLLGLIRGKTKRILPSNKVDYGWITPMSTRQVAAMWYSERAIATKREPAPVGLMVRSAAPLSLLNIAAQAMMAVHSSRLRSAQARMNEAGVHALLKWEEAEPENPWLAIMFVIAPHMRAAADVLMAFPAATTVASSTLGKHAFGIADKASARTLSRLEKPDSAVAQAHIPSLTRASATALEDLAAYTALVANHPMHALRFIRVVRENGLRIPLMLATLDPIIKGNVTQIVELEENGDDSIYLPSPRLAQYPARAVLRLANSLALEALLQLRAELFTTARISAARAIALARLARTHPVVSSAIAPSFNTAVAYVMAAIEGLIYSPEFNELVPPTPSRGLSPTLPGAQPLGESYSGGPIDPALTIDIAMGDTVTQSPSLALELAEYERRLQQLLTFPNGTASNASTLSTPAKQPIEVVASLSASRPIPSFLSTSVHDVARRDTLALALMIAAQANCDNGYFISRASVGAQTVILSQNPQQATIDYTSASGAFSSSSLLKLLESDERQSFAAVASSSPALSPFLESVTRLQQQNCNRENGYATAKRRLSEALHLIWHVNPAPSIVAAMEKPLTVLCAYALSQMALLNEQGSEWDEAIAAHQHALQSELILWGQNRASISKRFTHVGQLWFAIRPSGAPDRQSAQMQQRERDALSATYKAYNIAQNIWDAGDPRLATLTLTLARAYTRSQRLGKALQLFEEAAQIETDAAGPAHPSALARYVDLGNVYFAHGQIDKALQQYFKVSQGLFSLVGPNALLSQQWNARCVALYQHIRQHMAMQRQQQQKIKQGKA